MQKELEEMTTKEYVYCQQSVGMYIFEIHSTPKPQRQTQQGISFSGKKQFYDPSKQSKKSIQWQIMPYAPKEPLLGSIEMHLTFYLPIPKQIRGIERTQMAANIMRHHIRPDLDNLAYLVTNALKGIVYRDDSQICVMRLEKLYGEQPKTVIKVFEV